MIDISQLAVSTDDYYKLEFNYVDGTNTKQVTVPYADSDVTTEALTEAGAHIRSAYLNTALTTSSSLASIDLVHPVKRERIYPQI